MARNESIDLLGLHSSHEGRVKVIRDMFSAGGYLPPPGQNFPSVDIQKMLNANKVVKAERCQAEQVARDEATRIRDKAFAEAYSK